MAARYWVGGTGTWNTNTTWWSATDGGAGGASVPASGDDVYFTASSGAGTCTLGKHISVNSLTFSGGSTVFVSNNYNITWATMFTVSGGTRSFTFGTSTLTCTGTGGVGFNITSNPATWSAASANINIQGYSHSCYLTAWSPSSKVFCNTLNLTSTSNNTTNKSLQGSFTVENLTIVCTSQVGVGNYRRVSSTGNITVTGTLTVTGIDNARRVTLQGGTYTAAAVSLAYVDFDGVTGAGAAAPFTGTSLSDSRIGSAEPSAPTGITFTTPVTRYRVGASGNWSDTAYWSETSGGAGGASVPLMQDTVIFDSNTPAGTVTLNTANAFVLPYNYGGGFGLDNYTYGLPKVIGTGSEATLYASGTSIGYASTCLDDVKLASAFKGLTLVNIESTPWTINFRGSPTLYGFELTGKTTNTISLGRDINVSDFTSPRKFAIQSTGTFDAAGYNVSAHTVNLNFTGTVILGSGFWYWQSTVAAPTFTVGSGVTVNSAGSTIRMLIQNANQTMTFNGGGKNYNELVLQSGGQTGAIFSIAGSNSFSKITSNLTVAATLRFAIATTTSIGNWAVSGTAGNLITVNSSSAGTRATLSFTGGGNVNADYLSIRDISGLPSTLTWYMGANSTNTSNNLGLIFTAAPIKTGNCLFFGSNF